MAGRPQIISIFAYKGVLYTTICSICNCRLTSEDTHTITISNGVDDRKYIHNHFILCPTCYSNFKYQLEVAGTPIEGPEDRDDIKWPDDAEWDRTHPTPVYEHNNPDD